jgi:hypothetical protein
MKIAKEITLWSLDVYKIHIKEWPTVKDKILSLVPWDDINQRKNPEARENLDDSPHEMTWTDYYLQGGESLDAYDMASHGIDLRSCTDHIDYELAFFSMISPYIRLFLNQADCKFREVSKCWAQRYAKGDYHPPHDHGSEGYAAVFYAELDPKEHQSTEFMQPWIPTSGNRDMSSVQGVVEGDLIIFPSNLYHMAPPHNSDKYRTIISFNLS